jgi:hypothetical protein
MHFKRQMFNIVRKIGRSADASSRAYSTDAKQHWSRASVIPSFSIIIISSSVEGGPSLEKLLLLLLLLLLPYLVCSNACSGGNA